MTEESMDNEMVRELQKRTAELPREIVPPEEAWKRIKSQIDMETALVFMTPQKRERPIWHRPAFLAAAALLLVAGASLTTALVLGRRMVERQPTPVATAPVRSSTPATLTEFTAIENDYISTANTLSEIIETGKTDLAPETIAKLKESVRIIDAAIIEARRALVADPANTKLIELLSAQYNQKVDLLRRTSAMGES